MDPLTVLGIESSCDETAAAVVVCDGPSKGRILSNVVRSQLDAHAAYGGVVPEIAARAHVDCLDQLIAAALDEAGLTFSDLDGVAATGGPGLIGGLMVGLMTAKAIALAQELPFVSVNHLEGHALTVGLTDGIAPPYLLLLVSGGHTQLLCVHEAGRYERFGTTLDDALGEAFDKTAKLLGLGFPGGPEVERRAQEGDADRFDFPRPMVGRPEPHFSFSGLKTAVRRAAERCAPLTPQDIADLCAGFERAVAAVVQDRTGVAIARFRERYPDAAAHRLVVSGGVAANRHLRACLLDVAGKNDFSLHAPPIALCTDNGAMIAWAGAERLVRGPADPLDTGPRARWPLDANAPPAIGAGVKA